MAVYVFLRKGNNNVYILLLILKSYFQKLDSEIHKCMMFYGERMLAYSF